MIDLGTLVTGLVMGCVLIVFGLVPGLFERLAEGLRNFSGLLFYGISVPSRGHMHFGQPRCFAAAGVTLIAVSVAAYFAR